MSFFCASLFFLLGLMLGKVNITAGMHIPKVSVTSPLSHCLTCKTLLTSSKNIHSFTFLLRFGKCPTCRASTSPLYPIIELITGITFALVYLELGLTWETLMGLLFTILLVIITVSDLAYRVIPDRIVFPFLGIFLLLRLFIHPAYSYIDHLISMTIGFGLFLILGLISRGGVGGGDIKLFAVVGLFLGTPPLFLTIFLSALLAAFYGLILILEKGVGRKTAIPFGPFISMGAIISYLFGEQIINWYVSFFY